MAGRIAAKDAVRLLLRQSHGMNLRPANIEVATDSRGRHAVRGGSPDVTGLITVDCAACSPVSQVQVSGLDMAADSKPTGGRD